MKVIVNFSLPESLTANDNLGDTDPESAQLQLSEASQNKTGNDRSNYALETEDENQALETSQVIKEQFEPKNLGIPDFVVPPTTPLQDYLLKIPPSKIPEQLLFAPIPLEARMATGIVNLKQLANEQRKSLLK